MLPNFFYFWSSLTIVFIIAIVTGASEHIKKQFAQERGVPHSRLRPEKEYQLFLLFQITKSQSSQLYKGSKMVATSFISQED